MSAPLASGCHQSMVCRGTSGWLIHPSAAVEDCSWAVWAGLLCPSQPACAILLLERKNNYYHPDDEISYYIADDKVDKTHVRPTGESRFGFVSAMGVAYCSEDLARVASATVRRDCNCETAQKDDAKRPRLDDVLDDAESNGVCRFPTWSLLLMCQCY